MTPMPSPRSLGKKWRDGEYLKLFMAMMTAFAPAVGVIVSFVLARDKLPENSDSGAGTWEPLTRGELAVWSILILAAGVLGYYVWFQNRKLKSAKEMLKDRIHVIDPTQYVPILKGLVDKYGPGDLYLFNVELNTFSNRKTLQAIWGEVALMPGLKSVRLALPTRKYDLWVDIVTKQNPKFFESEAGQKFLACEFKVDKRRGEDRIAFALYNRESDPRHHDWGAMFLLDRPFMNADRQYQHIIEYTGNEKMLTGLRAAIWDLEYKEVWADSPSMLQRSASILADGVPLRAFLEAHECTEGPVADEIQRVVGVQRVVDHNAQSMVPLPRDLPDASCSDDGHRDFRLFYRQIPDQQSGPAESVRGYAVGVDGNKDGSSRPCIIWATGFGDGDRPKLAEILSRKIFRGDDSLAQIFFLKSGRTEDTTCTRIKEDLKAVLDYVWQIPTIDKQQICVVGISLCAYLAAKLAERDGRIRSVILVGAPFDIVEMLDEFRRHYHQGPGRVPLFADFLMARQNARIAAWNLDHDFCNYFNHVVTAAHLVDIAVRGPHSFGRRAFLESIGNITRSGRRVAFVYSRDDPIVDAPKNIPILDEWKKKNLIRPEYLFEHRLAAGAHYFPTRSENRSRFHDGSAGVYPFAIPSEDTTDPDEKRARARMIRSMAEAIKECVNETVLASDALADETGSVEQRPSKGDKIDKWTAQAMWDRALTAAQEGRDDRDALGRVKSILRHGFARTPTVFDDVLSTIEPKLAEPIQTLYGSIARAIVDESKVGELEALPLWREVKPVAIDGS